MGTQMLSLLLAVQHGVDRSRLGLATSLNQFSRSVGAAVGVSAMGAIMARTLAGVSLPAPSEGSTAIALSEPMRELFASGLHQVFVAGLVVSATGFVSTLFLPTVHFGRAVPARSGEQMLEAEMTTLRAEDEPIAVPE
jgi:hypothetical protein